MQSQQTILAALSLGPVGISDQLSSHPTNASATITSNVPLVMATVALTGDLLQPSYPLTPLERSLMSDRVDGSLLGSMQVWGTYTAVLQRSPKEASTTVGLWFTAFVFPFRGGPKNPTATVLESDLAPMVDAAALPSPSFGDIPTGSFQGGGTSFPQGPKGWVSWIGDFAAQRTAGCHAVNVSEWTGQATVAPTQEDTDTILNIAPLMGGQHALLGEQGKIAAVSTYRFAYVQAGTQGGIEVSLRGKPGEKVSLLFATRACESGPFACKSHQGTIGGDGTATVEFTGN